MDDPIECCDGTPVGYAYAMLLGTCQGKYELLRLTALACRTPADPLPTPATCYHLSPTKMNHTDAQTYCESNKMAEAGFTKFEELQEIFDAIPQLGIISCVYP